MLARPRADCGNCPLTASAALTALVELVTAPRRRTPLPAARTAPVLIGPQLHTRQHCSKVRCLVPACGVNGQAGAVRLRVVPHAHMHAHMSAHAQVFEQRM